MMKEVGRTVDLEMDHRGRVIIPSNLRNRFKIEPEKGDTTWLTVTIEEADVSDDGGKQ
jgi:bifunctional DNA-binding transcriptional regulator/antitoxin component of YhaV-PrlF toxin-antitoxin module